MFLVISNLEIKLVGCNTDTQTFVQRKAILQWSLEVQDICAGRVSSECE